MLFLHTLGTARIDAGTTRVTPSTSRKFALLLHLSEHAGRRVPRDVVRDLIFPGSTDDNARHSLRELLYAVRRDGVRIDSDKHGLVLAAEAVTSDYRELLAAERPDASQLNAAAGGFLPGYAPEHSEAFTEWLEAYRAQATFALCRRLLSEFARARRVGDWSQAERAARACLALDPLNEEATLGLAEMLAIGGAKIAAVRLLDQYVAEVGSASGDLTVSAAILRRRISEARGDEYRPTLKLPFVGRAREMELLTDKLGEVNAGLSRLVLISGSAGIGKSRIATEFAQCARLAGAIVESSSARAHHAKQPLSAFVELMPRLLRLPGALGSSPASLSRLRHLIAPDNSAPVEHGELSLTIEKAIADLFDALCAENPVILLLEDAHWLDQASRELCWELANGTAGRLMIIMTSREPSILSEFPVLADHGLHIPVAPLRTDVVERLARETVIDAGADVHHWMVQISAGNPLFLSSLILHFRSTGETVVPANLTELIGQRVARVGARALNVLRMCVILAEQCTTELLVDALGAPHIELLEALTELENHELLRPDGNQITTTHPLIDEAVLATSSPTILEIMHRRAANIMEAALERDANASLLWACANHWVAANVKIRAAAALRRCADYAMQIGQPHEAGAVIERIYELSDDAQDCGAAARDAVRAYTMSNDLSRAAHWASTARRHVPSISHDDFEICELRSHVLAGFDIELAEPRLIACIDSDAADEHRLEAGMLLAMLSDVYDRSAALEQVASQVETIASRLPNGSSTRLSFMMMYEAARGHVRAAAEIARKILELPKCSELREAARLQFNAALVLWRAGDMDGALRALEDAFVLAVRGGMIGLQMSIVTDTAHLLYSAAQFDTAREWLALGEVLESQNRRLDPRWDHVSLRTYYLIQDGDIEGALQFFQRFPAAPPHPAARPTRWLTACRVRLDVLRGVEVPGPEIQMLIARSERDNGSAEEPDFEVEAAWHALMSQDRAKEADALVREYVERTRTRLHPYCYGLQRIFGTCGIEIAPEKQGRLMSAPRRIGELLAMAESEDRVDT